MWPDLLGLKSDRYKEYARTSIFANHFFFLMKKHLSRGSAHEAGSLLLKKKGRFISLRIDSYWAACFCWKLYKFTRVRSVQIDCA